MLLFCAYQVDGHGFYWEIYTNNTHTYIATVEDDDMGDWIAQHRKEIGRRKRTLFYFLRNPTNYV